MSMWRYLCCSSNQNYEHLGKKDEDFYLNQYKGWMRAYEVDSVKDAAKAKEMAESLIKINFPDLGDWEQKLIGVRLSLVAEQGYSLKKAIQKVLYRSFALGEAVERWSNGVCVTKGLSSQEMMMWSMKKLAEKSISPISITVAYNFSSAKGLLLSRNQILTTTSLFKNVQKNEISIGKATYPFNPSQNLSVTDKHSDFAIITLNTTFKATLRPMINSSNLPSLGDPIYLLRAEKKAPYEITKGFFGKRYGLQMHYSVSSPIFGALVIDSQEKIIAFHSHEVTCECTGQQKCSVGVLAQSILKLSTPSTKK